MNVNNKLKDYIKITHELLENLQLEEYNVEDNLIHVFKEQSPNTIKLYHETNLDNLKQILKDGISLRNSLKYNGGCIWASDALENTNNWMYGDYAVCFEVNPKSAHKVNEHDYQVYTDIPISNILSIYSMSHRTEVGKVNLLKELGLNEALELVFEPLYKQLIERGFKFNTEPKMGAAYLMSDGMFLNMDDNSKILKHSANHVTHPDLDYYLEDENIFNLSPNRSLVKTDNAIRLNDGTNFEEENAVISLPKKPLTNKQYNQLENWLYKIMYVSEGVDVGDEETDIFDHYNFLPKEDGLAPEDIIKRIRNRYKNIEEKYYPTPQKLFNIENGEATWPEDAEDWIWWKSEADKWAEDYAKSYRVKMSPKDFLRLTTAGVKVDDLKVGDYVGGIKLRDLNTDEFNQEKHQNMFLQIAFRDKNNPNKAQVIGHEGRHRMFALMKAGVNKVDVELVADVWDTNYEKYKPFNLDYIDLKGQFNKMVTVRVYNPIPMSWKQHKSMRPNLKDEALEEKIIKVGNKWQVQSEKGKNLGTYDTKPEAENRLKQVHYFKHLNEEVDFELPQYLYHATYKPFLKSIKEKGLGNTRRKMWSDSKGKGVVYLALNDDVAYSYAETAEWLDDVEDYDKYANNIIVLKIDTNKLDKRKFFKDENVLDDDSTIEYRGIIPFDAVVEVIEESLKHVNEGLKEKLLVEKRRSELISKSKSSDDYSKNNQHRGRNRWERRKYSRISTSVADYNKIDMNAFWKGDILEFGIKVQGETNNYVVTVLFENILERLRREVQYNKNKLEFKCILRALIQTFNSEDVYIHCTCPDFTYRQAYWATKGNYNSGTPQFDPGKGIANPNDSKGAGCKHVNLILANMTWMMKIASVINNYIWYCKDNMELNYANYIFPQIYDMPYDKAIQLTLFDSDDLQTDEATINLSNALGRRRTQFKPRGVPGGNPRFERPKVEREDPNQLKLDLETNNNEVGVENEEES